MKKLKKLLKKLLRTIDYRIELALEWAMTSKSAFYILSLLIWIAIILQPPKDLEGWLLVLVSVYYQGAGLPGIGNSNKKESKGIKDLIKAIYDNGKEDVELAKEQRGEILGLAAFTHERLDAMEERFNRIEEHFDKMQLQLDNIERLVTK